MCLRSLSATFVAHADLTVLRQHDNASRGANLPFDYNACDSRKLGVALLTADPFAAFQVAIFTLVSLDLALVHSPVRSWNVEPRASFLEFFFAISISSIHGDSKIWPSRSMVSVRRNTKLQTTRVTTDQIAAQTRRELMSKVRESWIVRFAYTPCNVGQDKLNNFNGTRKAATHVRENKSPDGKLEGEAFPSASRHQNLRYRQQSVQQPHCRECPKDERDNDAEYVDNLSGGSSC